jgi:hypothetical protein
MTKSERYRRKIAWWLPIGVGVPVILFFTLPGTLVVDGFWFDITVMFLIVWLLVYALFVDQWSPFACSDNSKNDLF